MSTSPAPEPNAPMFREPEAAKAPTKAIGIAAVAIVILIAVVVLITRKPPEVENASYAPNIAFSDVKMIESTSLSGGKSFYLDGHVKNTGSATVTGINVRVLFANDVAMPPQVQTAPVMLIRAVEPYVDTQTVDKAPIAPGEQREFRLTFENVADNWNQQVPVIQVTDVKTR